jgi:hypothetical protein
MVSLTESLSISDPFYFIADAYYASGKIIKGLVEKGNHLITLVRSNAVAYYPAARNGKHRSRGRPQIYGDKIKLKSLFDDPDTMQTASSPVYGEKGRYDFDPLI